MSLFSLTASGITAAEVVRNAAPAALVEAGIRDDGSKLTDRGALVAYSGAKTGRSPNDKRIIRAPASDGDVWWGKVNIPLEPTSFQAVRKLARDFLSTQPRVYVFDGFAGWHPQHRLKVRVVCSRPYHALFMHTMLIRPTADELAAFGEPDFTITNAGQAQANKSVPGVTSGTSIALSFADRELVILGSEYAGEMKKGIFTLMNYLMPKRGVLSMHCSATADPATHRTSLLFGLSGTGKTTLSADPKRELVGDDEHCWADDGVFNIEGGCYAKTINLSPEGEPDIYRALRYGAVLENVPLRADHTPDFADRTITENTRGAYPVESIPNARIPCVAGHPTDVIFLTCDAFGVLPPVSRLSPEQAMYHFISGYTAKIAGTEVGVTEPEATFSACFGAAFLVWHPAKYAEMLASKLRQHGVNVWLVNTGWSGGGYGVGKRMKLAYTRAIVDAIHAGQLASAPTRRDPVFGLDVPTAVPGVPADILDPRATWADGAAYDAAAAKLAGLFRKNFEPYAAGAGPAVVAAGPRG